MTDDDNQWTADFLAEIAQVFETNAVDLANDEVRCSFIVKPGMSSWKQTEPVTARVQFGSPARWGANQNVTPAEAAWTSFHDMVTEALDTALSTSNKKQGVTFENWHPTERWT